MRGKLFFSLLKTTEIFFGSTKMGIFYWEKAFHIGKKNRKNDFTPSETYSSYTPDSNAPEVCACGTGRVGKRAEEGD